MSTKKANIYVDCVGNVDTDVYFKEEEIPKLKHFLESLGYTVESIESSKVSTERQKPFIQDKPRVSKKIVHEVDWANPKVIFKLLEGFYKDNKYLLKDLITESGKVDPEKSKATEFTAIAKPSFIFKEYEKWKIENKIVENNTNRTELHKDFSEFYAEEEKKKRQKRLQHGTKVYIIPKNKAGIIKEYKDEKGVYSVEDEEGYAGYYKRKDLKVEDEPK